MFNGHYNSGSSILNLKTNLPGKEDELSAESETNLHGGGKTFTKKIKDLIGKKKGGKLKKTIVGQGDNPITNNGESDNDETLLLLLKARNKLEVKAQLKRDEMEDTDKRNEDFEDMSEHKYYTEVDDEEQWLCKTPLDSSTLTLFDVKLSPEKEDMQYNWANVNEQGEGPEKQHNHICDSGTEYSSSLKNKDLDGQKHDHDSKLKLPSSLNVPKDVSFQNKRGKKRKATFENDNEKVKCRKKEIETGSDIIVNDDHDAKEENNIENDKNNDNQIKKDVDFVNGATLTVNVNDILKNNPIRDQGKKPSLLKQILSRKQGYKKLKADRKNS